MKQNRKVREKSMESLIIGLGTVQTLKTNYQYAGGINHYHIFCCNTFVFACPIIAKSQCWLFALRTNTGRISPQISVFALIYPCLPPNSTSGICAVVSKIIYVKVQGKITGVGSSINNKVCFIASQRSSRCPYTLLLIELPTPVER